MEFLFTDKLSQEMLSNVPQEFEGVKIVTWYAMIQKGFKPLNWFIMNAGTKISYRKLNGVSEIDKEMQKLNDYIQKQNRIYNKRGAENEVTAM